MSKAARQSKALYFVLSRLLQSIPLVLGVIVINFVLIHMAPGDPAVVLAGEYADPTVVEQLREEFGLNRPVIVQLVIYVGRVMSGDFGYSYRYRMPVIDMIMSRLPNTLLLLLVTFVLSSLIGVVMALYSARRANSLPDNVVSGVAMFGYCMPPFWSGMMFVVLFSSILGWFPTGGMYSLKANYKGFAFTLDVLHHLVLPALTYTAYFLAISFRLTRAKVIEALREDYITTARAKGLTETEVLYHHALRNSLVPVVAVLGLNLGVMIGGSVTIETVFSWPGIGRLMYDAIMSRDYPLLLGIFVIVSIGIIIANFIADVATVLIDPRIAAR